MIVSMMQTLVVPILGLVQRDLHTTASGAGWLTTATLLSAAVCTPLLGRHGDRHGAKPTLVGVLAVTLAGSVLAAVTDSLPWLIAARALQGASTAVFPLAQSVLRAELPRERLPAAMGALSGTLALGNGLALAGAALLTRGTAADHHDVFWLSAGVSALTLAAVAVVVPRARPGTGGHTASGATHALPGAYGHAVSVASSVRPGAGGRTDWGGAGALAAMLVLLLLPLSQGARWGWASVPTLGCLAAAAAASVVWVRVERRSRDPLVDMRMFVRRPVLFANLAGVLLGFAMFAQFLSVSALARLPAPPHGYGFGATVLETSLVFLMPSAVASLGAAQVAGALVRRLGPRRTLAAGAACGAAGFAALALAHGSVAEVVAASALVGVAVSFGFATLPALLLGAVPPGLTGVANGVNSVARSVGSSLASALTATLLAAPVPAEGRLTACFALGGAALALVALVATAAMSDPMNHQKGAPSWH
ncbi:Major Facilitator Superfamily protein [Nonomuraea maritima]|uniref:Major Facilitator Superfamily protein n=1 Tax=Nonomuraea maritima TaxID=683260 RepID=A0A1G8YFU9_9ACTN|nr:MFS transporter [Nonomuraea maritima]SDK01115.1 Major Facilitator Superfamily protein [Nonomuraea maritima]